MRLPDWPERLQRLIDGRREALFSWGRFDCCAFAMDAYEACIGQRPEIAAYDSERGAARVLRELGGMAEAAGRVTGSQQISPALAQRGDLIMVRQEGRWGYALAVCAGSVTYAPGDCGLVAVPMERHVTAWRV